MQITDTPELTPFPAPPWRMVGRCWAGLFRADRPLPPPFGLRPLLGPRTLAVALIRYRAGTLHYDELLVGAPVWRGLRAGLFVHELWVDSRPSLAGGRAIWGLPKQLASFAWSEQSVTVTDERGPVATIELWDAGATTPPLWLPAYGVGRRRHAPLFFPIGLWARLRPGGLRLRHWEPRGYRLPQTPVAGLALDPFRATFGAALR